MPIVVVDAVSSSNGFSRPSSSWKNERGGRDLCAGPGVGFSLIIKV